MFAKYGPVLVGIPLLILGVLWTLSPSMAAEALTSELLTGAALTTQIGDSAAFFLGSGFLLIAGGLRAERDPDFNRRLLGGTCGPRTDYCGPCPRW